MEGLLGSIGNMPLWMQIIVWPAVVGAVGEMATLVKKRADKHPDSFAWQVVSIAGKFFGRVLTTWSDLNKPEEETSE